MPISKKEKRERKWRNWRRNRKLRAQGLLPPVVPAEKQPGSQKQRQYARRVLKCKKIDENTWQVWGGREEHIIENFVCDCWKAQVERKICSHIIRIGMGETE